MTKQKINKQAFTLVELIVVITILAILWTIAFISLAWYSQDARDSTRISDLSTMKTSLELFHLNAWKYPLTTDGFDVVYSWSVVWSQWTFWINTKNNVEKLDKIPTDPLTDKEYTYSTTKTRQEYQLSWIFEWDNLVNNSLLNKTYAWDTLTTALVTWNYNWKILKTLSWSDCAILSLPSIISSQDETVNELTTILTNTWLVYNWYKNLPTNYRSSKYNAEWWFNFNSNKLIAYSDTNECTDIYDSEDNTARITLITNLQIAYSWTILSSKDWIKKLVNVDLNDDSAIDSLWATLVTNNLWWDVKASNSLWVTRKITFDAEWDYIQEDANWTKFLTWIISLETPIDSSAIDTSKISSLVMSSPGNASISNSTEEYFYFNSSSNVVITFNDPLNVTGITMTAGLTSWWGSTPMMWANSIDYWNGSSWTNLVYNTNASYFHSLLTPGFNFDVTTTQIKFRTMTYNNGWFWGRFEIIGKNWALYYITTSDQTQIDTTWMNWIKSVSFTSTKPVNTDLKYLISFDWRTTWKYWDWSAWQTSVLWDISINWMNETILWWLNSSNFWATWWFQAWTTPTVDFAINLESTGADTPELDKISVKLINY